MGCATLFRVALEPVERGEEEGSIIGPHTCLDVSQTPDLGVDPLAFRLGAAGDVTGRCASLRDDDVGLAMSVRSWSVAPRS
jgi:hypothetical protein